MVNEVKDFSAKIVEKPVFIGNEGRVAENYRAIEIYNGDKLEKTVIVSRLYKILLTEKVHEQIVKKFNEENIDFNYNVKHERARTIVTYKLSDENITIVLINSYDGSTSVELKVYINGIYIQKYMLKVRHTKNAEVNIDINFADLIKEVKKIYESLKIEVPTKEIYKILYEFTKNKVLIAYLNRKFPLNSIVKLDEILKEIYEIYNKEVKVKFKGRTRYVIPLSQAYHLARFVDFVINTYINKEEEDIKIDEIIEVEEGI